MALGWYDAHGYPHIYTGPTNGGVFPLNNGAWGSGECPLSASHLGIDGRSTRGHVDDYWISYESGGPDPYYGNWTEHSPRDCTADFMGTNQAYYGNTDGSTLFWFYGSGAPFRAYSGLDPDERDGGQGVRLMLEALGYTVLDSFNQLIYGYNGNTQGFTYEQYQAQIDAGRPVLIHVAGHTMAGFGYDTDSDDVLLCDTWDHDYHAMEWGTDYAGMTHYGVTVVQLDPHTIAITVGPSGAPNPVASGGAVACSATGVDSIGGHSVVYSWSARDGGGAAAGSFDDATSQTPTWTAPANRTDAVVNYNVSVLVRCATTPSVSRTASYVQGVTPVEHTLEITAGPSGNPDPVGSGGDVVCSVTAEDSRQGHGLTYSWTATDGGGAPAGSFDDATDASPTWTAPANTSESDVEYEIGVVVTCATDGSIQATGSFTQTVNPVPHAVNISAGPEGTPNPVASGGTVACSVTAADTRDGHTVNYTWTATDGSGDPAGAFDDPTSANPTWTAPENRTDAVVDYTLQVVAACTGDPSVNATEQYTQGVSPVEHTLTITDGPTVDPGLVASGANVACTVTTEDSRTGHTCLYEWTATDGEGNPAGSFDDPTAASPTWLSALNRSDAVAEYEITVVVRCASDNAVTDTASCSIQVEPVDHAVSITDGPAGDPNPCPSGGQVQCTVGAADSRIGHTLSYAWTATDGDGDAAGAFDDATSAAPTWTAPANTTDDPVSYTIAVTVSCQGDPSINDSGAFTVDVEPVPHTVTLTDGPTVTPASVASSGEAACSAAAVDSRTGHTISYLWTATDGEGVSVGGFNDPHSQNPTWTAPANISDAPRQYTLTVVASCSDHPEISDQGTCTVDVDPAAHLIIITEPAAGLPNPRTSGGPVLCGVHAHDTHGHGVTYQWTAEDAEGNAVGVFDDATAQFPSWTAPENLTDAAIAYDLTVTVSCVQTPAVSTTSTFAVLVNPVGHYVTIIDGPTAAPNPVGSAGQVELRAAAIDSRDGHTVSYTWTARDVAGNPAGTFDDATAQTPVWTAPENQGDHTARYTITCTVTCDEDADVTAVGTVIVHVSPVEHAVTITAGPEGDADGAEAGEDVQCTVTAECSRAGHALQYAWTARDGSGAAAGSFSNATAPNPVWHAPTTVPAENNEYQISVTVSCQSDTSVKATASFVQQITRPVHAIDITGQPQGPGAAVNSGATVQCSVEAGDTHGHALTYLWTAADADGDPAGSFNNASLQHPRWTAPDNETGVVAEYTLTVTITCPEDSQITREASFVQQVRPVAVHTFASGARMIGVPAQSAAPPDVQAAAGIADAVWWDPDLPAYVPHNAADPFVVARGYWARFQGATTLLVHGSAITDDVDQLLDAGWHMVASPYQQVMPLDAIVECAGLKPYAWTDQGHGYELVAPIRDALNVVHNTLVPWWGYWVEAESPSTLHWSPVTPAADGAVELLDIGAADADRGGWQIQLVAEADGRADACNFLGIAGEAAVAALKIANPPLRPEGADLYFPTADRLMAADVRPLASTDLQWNFVVASASDGQVTLSFPDLSSVPAEYRLTLTDVAAGKSLNMRTSHAYQYSGVGTRAFRIDVTRGNGNTLTVSTADARQLNSAAAIVAYTLSTAADVTVEVRNIAGRRVAQLACGQAAAGANTATWNLCGAGGARVPAGTYLCTITARSDEGTQASAVRPLTVNR